MVDDDNMIVAEPAAATLSESVTRSGLLGQVMGLSRTDEVGRIVLTKQMRDAYMKAERDLEEGKCLSESDFKERFAKWL